MSTLVQNQTFGLLLGSDGTRIELGKEAFAALRTTLKVFTSDIVQSEGSETESWDDPWITTGQAAELVGVSRRTLTRMLEAGEIDCQRLGSGHRRLRLSSVLSYAKEHQNIRTKAFDSMREHALQAGFYDLESADAFLSQFD